MTNTTNRMAALPVGQCSLRCTTNPEWGTWGVREDRGDYYVLIATHGTRVVSKAEAERFWEVVSR